MKCEKFSVTREYRFFAHDTLIFIRSLICESVNDVYYRGSREKEGLAIDVELRSLRLRRPTHFRLFSFPFVAHNSQVGRITVCATFPSAYSRNLSRITFSRACARGAIVRHARPRAETVKLDCHGFNRSLNSTERMAKARISRITTECSTRLIAPRRAFSLD